MESIYVFLPLIVLASIVWGLVFFFRKMAGKYPPVTPEILAAKEGKEAKPAGVAGWLMFLVVSLMILGPFLGAGRMLGEFSQAESQYPQLAQVAIWESYKASSWLLYWVTVGMSVYAGWLLLAKRTAAAVRRVIYILWISGPGLSLVTVMVTYYFLRDGLGAQEFGAFLGGVLGACISATIWTIYLKKSKRVKATYGV